MKRSLLAVALSLAAAVSAAGPLAAQHTMATPAAADTLTKLYVGTWEGPYTSPHGSGTLRLVITRDSTWKGSMGLTSDMPLPVSALTDFKVTDARVTWTQEIMNIQCTGAAAIVEGSLSGSVNCGQADLPFILRKK
jgi:hypothetical protein